MVNVELVNSGYPRHAGAKSGSVIIEQSVIIVVRIGVVRDVTQGQRGIVVVGKRNTIADGTGDSRKLFVNIAVSAVSGPVAGTPVVLPFAKIGSPIIVDPRSITVDGGILLMTVLIVKIFPAVVLTLKAVTNGDHAQRELVIR